MLTRLWVPIQITRGSAVVPAPDPHALYWTEPAPNRISITFENYLWTGKSGNRKARAIAILFGRMKKSLGFGPDYVFHSIRKTVATQLENASIPESVSADILGHEKRTLTYGSYSGGTKPQLKKEAIENLAYPIQG